MFFSGFVFIILVLQILSSNAFNQYLKYEPIHNVSNHTLKSKLDVQSTKLNNEIEVLIFEIDRMMCKRLSRQIENVEKLNLNTNSPKIDADLSDVENDYSNYNITKFNGKIVTFLETMLDKYNFKNHIKRNGTLNKEAVDGGKGSKKSKNAKTVPSLPVEEDADIAPEEVNSQDLPPEASPEPDEKTPKKEFYGMGLSYYDSNEEDEESKEEPMCNWQNYLDKYRWLRKKDDEDDENPPSYYSQATPVQATPAMTTPKDSEGERSTPERQDDNVKDDINDPISEHLLNLISKVTSCLEECVHCATESILKQVMDKLVFLMHETAWSVEKGNRLVGLFNRLIKLNNKRHSREDALIGHFFEYFLANQVTRSIVPLLNRDFPLAFSSATHSYIHLLAVVSLTCVYYSTQHIKSECLGTFSKLTSSIEPLKSFNFATGSFRHKPSNEIMVEWMDRKDNLMGVQFQGINFNSVLLFSELSKKSMTLLINPANPSTPELLRFKFLFKKNHILNDVARKPKSAFDTSQHPDQSSNKSHSYACLSKINLTSKWSKESCKTQVDAGEFVVVTCECIGEVKLVSYHHSEPRVRAKRQITESLKDLNDTSDLSSNATSDQPTTMSNNTMADSTKAISRKMLTSPINNGGWLFKANDTSTTNIWTKLTGTQRHTSQLTVTHNAGDTKPRKMKRKHNAFYRYLKDSNLWAFVLVILIWIIFFILGIWAKIKDKTVKILRMPIDLADNSARCKYIYLVIVKTGGRLGSGTSSDIFFNITGTLGISASHHFYCHKYTVLQRLHTNIFLMRTMESLGELVAIKFWHRNNGESPAWFVSWVATADLQSKRIYYFLCNSWVGHSMFKGETVLKMFQVAPKKNTLNIRYLLTYNTSRNFTDNHTLFSIFLSPPTSRFTRFERVGVCMNLLLGYLMCNLIFLSDVQSKDEVQKKSIGRLMFSMERIQAAFYCTLVMFPVTTGIEVLFQVVQRRNRKIGIILDWKLRDEIVEHRGVLGSSKQSSHSPIFLIHLLEIAKSMTTRKKQEDIDKQNKLRKKTDSENQESAEMQRRLEERDSGSFNVSQSHSRVVVPLETEEFAAESYITDMPGMPKQFSELVRSAVKFSLASDVLVKNEVIKGENLEEEDEISNSNSHPDYHTNPGSYHRDYNKQSNSSHSNNDNVHSNDSFHGNRSSNSYCPSYRRVRVRCPSGKHDVYTGNEDTWKQVSWSPIDVRNNENSLNEYRSERFDNGVFPWPFVYLAWAITITCMFFFSFTVIYRTFKFKKNQFLYWFTGCFMSFFMGMLIDDPAKIIIIAFVYSLIVRKVREHAFRNANLVRHMCLLSLENVDVDLDDESLEKMHSNHYSVPQQTLNMLLVEAEIIKANSRQIISNFLCYITIASTAIITVVSLQNHLCFETNCSYYRTLYNPDVFWKMKTVPEFWDWTLDVWLNEFYPPETNNEIYDDDYMFKLTRSGSNYLAKSPVIKRANGTSFEWAFFLDGVLATTKSMQRIGMNRSRAKAKLEELEGIGWLGGITYYTKLETLVYNPSTDMAVHIATKAFIMPGGDFRVYGEVNAIPLFSHDFTSKCQMFMVYVVCMVMQAVLTARNITYLGVADFFGSFWNLLDLFVTVLALFFIPTALILIYDISFTSSDLLTHTNIDAEDIFLSRLILRQMMNTSVVLHLFKGFSFLRFRRHINWYFQCLGNSTVIILIFFFQILFPMIGVCIFVHLNYGMYHMYTHAIEYAFTYSFIGWMGAIDYNSFTVFFGLVGHVPFFLAVTSFSLAMKGMSAAVIWNSFKYHTKSLSFHESLYALALLRDVSRIFSMNTLRTTGQKMTKRIRKVIKRKSVYVKPEEDSYSYLSQSDMLI